MLKDFKAWRIARRGMKEWNTTHRYQMDRIGFWSFHRGAVQRRRHPAICPDCVGKGVKPHAECIDCGIKTCGTSLRIDPVTLRRFKARTCGDCYCRPNHQQSRLRTERAHKDWQEITDPIAQDSVRLGQLPEQIPGPARRALRAFHASSDYNAVVPDIHAATLNESIATLGLGDEMYAETRGTETVLRKTQKARA